MVQVIEFTKILGKMNIKRLVHSIIITSIVFALVGCSAASGNGQLVKRSEAPLNDTQQKLLSQIEALPIDQRLSFIEEHRSQVMKMSARSKTFGERLSADLPRTTPK
jgi:hypothetical protein